MLPVVLKDTMRHAEERAFQEGLSQDILIRRVAQGIQQHVEFQKLIPKKPILLLVGRGCNGQDALALGCELLRSQKQVLSYCLSNHKPSALHDEFLKLGGTELTLEALDQQPFGLIIDGLLGTGSTPRKDEELHQVILKANSKKAPIVSIDIPSGIDPIHGTIFDIAIQATCTFACQAPKLGCFLGNAWSYVGELYTVDIGLVIPKQAYSYATILDAQKLLPPIERTTHKYRKGTLSLFCGSFEMPGAPALVAKAAFHSGAGYVRSYTEQQAYEGSLLLPLEAVRIMYDKAQLDSLVLPTKGALVVGPGLGRKEFVPHLVEKIIKTVSLPMVIDGDALHYIPKGSLPHALLTPHRKEAEDLLGQSFQTLSQQHLDVLLSFSKASESYLILKGSPTYIFGPDGEIIIMGLGTPALATAGTGDVLSGILGALLAEGLSRRDASILGTILHALAGRAAADKQTIYGVTASQVIEELPQAFTSVKTAPSTPTAAFSSPEQQRL